MILHRLFERHSADLLNCRWDDGQFVTNCLGCGDEMIKPPGGDWRIVSKAESANTNRP